MIESKAWNWEGIDDTYWKEVAEEFLPTALRWKHQNRKKILDLGCGIGRNALYLSRNGFDVYAFDLSDSGLLRLKREADNEKLVVHITKGDMLSLPYADEFFDCVLAFHSIYHTDYKGLNTVISEIHRVMKIDSEAYITLNSKENDAWNQPDDTRIDAFTLIKTEPGEVKAPHTYLSFDEVEEILALFTVMQIQQIFDYEEDKKHAHFHIKIRKKASS